MSRREINSGEDYPDPGRRFLNTPLFKTSRYSSTVGRLDDGKGGIDHSVIILSLLVAITIMEQ